MQQKTSENLPNGYFFCTYCPEWLPGFDRKPWYSLVFENE